MNKPLIVLLFLCASVRLNAQDENRILQFSIKLDSSYLFIDNSNRNWYTLEMKTDTFFKVEGNIFFSNKKTFQIGSLYFKSVKPEGVMGSVTDEEIALKNHKKWELDYQRKTLRKKLNDGEEFYYGQYGKPFLIWWYQTPKNVKCQEREIEIEINTNPINDRSVNDTSEIILNATHQLFLDFVIHGNTIVTCSLPVFENENLQDEINRLKTLANTLNIYGSYIDIEILAKRLKDKERNIVLQDSQGLIEIELPSWLNVCQSNLKDVFSISFPEKENITNGAAILCEMKSDSVTFESFKNRYLAKGIDSNSLKLLSKEPGMEQYFFTKKNSWFYGKCIFLEGEKTYCFINFIATKTTYDFNLGRLDELVKRVKIR